MEDSRLGQLSAAFLPAATYTACRVAEHRLACPGPVLAGASRGGRDGAQRAGSLGHAWLPWGQRGSEAGGLLFDAGRP